MRVGLVAIFGLLIVSCSDGGATSDTDGAGATTVDTLTAAVSITQSSLPVDLIDEIVADYIDELCRAASTGETSGVVSEAAAFPVGSSEDLRHVLDAMASGARAYCPERMATRPDLIDEIAGSVRSAAATPGVVPVDGEVPPSTLSSDAPPSTL